VSAVVGFAAPSSSDVTTLFTNSSQIATIFNTIGTTLSKLRLARRRCPGPTKKPG
jgi:hypothetical protein